MLFEHRRFPLLVLLSLLFLSSALSSALASSAFADVSHIRVVRLSLVEGDVRFARDVRDKDPLTDSSVLWEAAQLNLPIRQGNVVATDSGRAEVELENGAMAFLDNNTVLEFYDLSLENGARTSRLVLRQGSASFYVNPASGDYFSVTGGDFTVEATSKSRFRINNFDDGSDLAVEAGRVTLVRKGGNLVLSKGQSFTMKAGDEQSAAVGRLADDDAFDRWVSGRIDTVTTAVSAGQQYSGGNYDAGYGDLYTYGSWLPAAGYGYGWRPYGVGPGWCPFDNGGWYYDPFFGWGFIGYQPWGWLPYHYGSWIFSPGIGWIWTPVGFRGGWRPATGVFVRGHNGLLGVVPVHPLDARGKTPVNLAQGVFPVSGSPVGISQMTGSAHEWKVLKAPPKDAPMSSVIARSAPPERISRTLMSGQSGARVVTLSRNSSIVYDPKEHKFVNTGEPSLRGETGGSTADPVNGQVRRPDAVDTGSARKGPAPANSAGSGTGRSGAPPPRNMTPPPPSAGGARGSWGGSRGSTGGGSANSSRGAASSGGARPGPAAGAHPSSGGGGRPH